MVCVHKKNVQKQYFMLHNTIAWVSNEDVAVCMIVMMFYHLSLLGWLVDYDNIGGICWG